MQAPRDELLAIDPRLIHVGRTPSAPSQAFRAVSVPVGTRAAWPSVRGTSSPPPHSSEWGSSSSDTFEAILMRIEALEALTEDQDQKVAYLQKKVESQDTLLKRLAADGGWDADGENEDEEQQQQQHTKRKRRKVSDTRKLTKGNTAQLTEKQKKVRKELLSFVGIQLRELSGTPANSPLPPKDLPPGEQKLPNGREVLIPDFTKEVTDKNNERLISQAAYLVHREQSNAASCQLRHKDVEFTEKDVDVLAKVAFRNWKMAYVRETDMAAKAKAAVHAKKAARTQRKRQKKMDRLDMKEEYLVSYGADPSSLLLTNWMSEYMSDLEDGDDHQKHVHRIKMKAAAGFSLQNQDDDEVIWERVRPAFRSNKINTVYQRLDELRKVSKRDAGKKNASNKRIDLGRVNDRVPVVPPYPFMVDATWRRTHVDGEALDEPFQTKREDPAGFGSKEQEDMD